MTSTIRRATESDAQALLLHRQAIMAETPFMLFEAGELDRTVEEERQRIARLNARHNSLVLIATFGDQRTTRLWHSVSPRVTGGKALAGHLWNMSLPGLHRSSYTDSSSPSTRRICGP
jgi:hypothetical protein